MAKTPDDDTRQAVALFRYGLVADLVNLPPGTPGIGTRLRAKAERDYDIPGTDRTRVAAETLRDWMRLYRRAGRSPRTGEVGAQRRTSRLTGRARMARWAGYPTDGTLVWFDGIGRGWRRPAERDAQQLGSTWARLRRASRAVVYRTIAKRRACAAGGGPRGPPGAVRHRISARRAQASAIVTRRAETLGGSVRRSRIERGPQGRRPTEAAHGSAWRPRREPNPDEHRRSAPPELRHPAPGGQLARGHRTGSRTGSSKRRTGGCGSAVVPLHLDCSRPPSTVFRDRNA